MKYEVLFNRAKETGPVCLLAHEYPGNITLPIDGYMVPVPEHTIIGDERGFDDDMDAILADCERTDWGFLLVTVEGGEVFLDCGPLFKSKEYAFGYADGVGSNVIYDAFAGRLIFRSDKEDCEEDCNDCF